MVTARYIWNTDTLRKGFAIHRKTQHAAKLIPLIAMAFVAWGAYESYTSGHWATGLPTVVVGLLLLFGSRPLAMWQFSRAVRRSPSYSGEMTYTFDPQEIMNSSEGHHATFTWKKLYSATVTRDGILLYTNKNFFHWIPAAAFESPSGMTTVQTYLQENGVRTQNA
jgi:hypothetical protein